jgi:hypothetical protein
VAKFFFVVNVKLLVLAADELMIGLDFSIIDGGKLTPEAQAGFPEVP